MQKEYFISIYLDTRRMDVKPKCPVKLRVFTPHPRIQKLYATKFEFTEKEFQSIWTTAKPRAEHKDIRNELRAIELKAEDVAKKLSYFDFEIFEQQMFGVKQTKQKNVEFYYQEASQKFNRNGQIRTALNYDVSYKSFVAFQGNNNILFQTITPNWLNDYEKYMIETKGRSQTTVSMYLRTLRTIFNNAIADKSVSIEQYPFGRRKYAVPAPKAVKKALSKDELKTLWDSEPKSIDAKKAKAFWFFSYFCNGMNIKDIVNLKYKDIDNDVLMFNRAKTANSNKSQSKVVVYLNDFTKDVIKQFGNTDKNPENYVFPINISTQTPLEKYRNLSNFIRYINQHFLKFAQQNNIDANVSTYWARHSYATNAIRNGASMEFVSEALSHSNLTTTRNYFAGFENEKKKEIALKLMEF